MEINVSNENEIVVLKPLGKIDYDTAPELEKLIEEQAQIAKTMVIDMSEVDYISSAGLRCLLFAYNLMSEKDGIVIKNVNACVKEILEISGFSKELNIE